MVALNVAIAEDKGESQNRVPGSSDFTQAYLDQIQDERAKEYDREKTRKEHDRYMKQLGRTDRLTRGN